MRKLRSHGAALRRCAGIAVGVLAFAATSAVTAREAVVDHELSERAEGVLGFQPRAIVNMVLPATPGGPVVAAVPIDDEWVTLLLHPYSNRTEGYRVLVQDGANGFVEVEPGPVRTMRGMVLELDGSRAAGSLLEDGLYARIDIEGETYWIQPLDETVEGVQDGDHVLYAAADVPPVDGACGVPDELPGFAPAAGDELGFARKVIASTLPGFNGLPGSGGAVAGGPCVAELACDADTEYFQDYGSVSAVESRINSVINTVNAQYEAQVGITHQITTILVRTSSDPYTSTDAQTRLCQFITEWTNNQQGIQRDVAHLFTGAELNGGTIGIAADIGDTGICQNIGSCVGGTFGTQGSYCLSQSDFNGIFGCATDLTAHELGHLWGAFHCSCPSFTMNPSITCANQFSGGSINSILNYRDTRSCLTGCGGGGGIENDLCSDAIPFNGDAEGVIAYSTIGANTDGPASPSGQCNDFGQTQTWSDIWYTYTAECSGDLTVTTCDDIHGQGDPTYDTDLVVYGPYASVGAINCNSSSLLANLAACNDDDPVRSCGTSAPYSSTIEIPVSAGEVYLIRVGGWSSGDSGTGFLEVDCQGSAPATGACCFDDGSCSVTTQSACTGGGGTYQGNGTTCGGVSCPQPTGACCFSDGSCADVDADLCSSAGGEFQGEGTTCSTTDCPLPTGACCFGDGSCLELEAVDCGSAGGTYQGDGTTCGGVSCPGPSGFQAEAATIGVGGADVLVNLDNTYTSPVVVCTVYYNTNAVPVVPRVSDVTSTSFRVRLQNPSGGAVSFEALSYLVMEEGVWDLGGGVRCEAAKYTSTVTDDRSSWVGQQRGYGQSYSNPVVIGQVMSDNDLDWSVFWCRGSNRANPPNANNLWTGKTVCEDFDTTRANETVGYIVFEAGTGTIGGVTYEAGLGGDSIRGVGNNPPYTYGLSSFANTPTVNLATQAAMDGANGGWAYVYGGPSATSLPLAIDEDQVRDGERSHTTEQVGYVSFQSFMTAN